MTRVLRLGTRRSALALAQSGWVARRIEQAAGGAVRVELVEVTTDGDTSTAPLTSFGGVGVFVSSLRTALLAGEIDLAVHSLKDLPTAPAPGLVVAAIPPREDPRDVLVARDGASLAELPAGSRIGTGSPRRAAQLRAMGFGLEVVDLRGNVDTRIARVLGSPDRGPGDLDGVVLARAGLLRLGRDHEASEVIDPLVMLPAPGQGALAVECRAPGGHDTGDTDAAQILALLTPLDDAATRACVEAERALLATLEAGCAAPLGALAEIVDDVDGEQLWLRAVVASVDGSHSLRRSALGSATDAASVGVALAAELLAEGAGEFVGRHPVAAARGEVEQ
ncbi:MAG: hydroxymethylbilane synthase [Kineosporiaceae bacterium]